MKRNRTISLFAIVGAMIGLAGCSGYVSTTEGVQVNVTGKVPAPAGKSVKDFIIFFQPTAGEAQQVQFPLDASGSFSGKMVAGQYTYYLIPGKGAATEKALDSFPEAYRRGSLDRQIEVKAGTLELKF